MGSIHTDLVRLYYNPLISHCWNGIGNFPDVLPIPHPTASPYDHQILSAKSI